MLRDESFALHEHAAGAATRIVDPALVGLQHLHQQPDDGTCRVELAAALALGSCETAKEILLDSPEEISGAVRLLGHADTIH